MAGRNSLGLSLPGLDDKTLFLLSVLCSSRAVGDGIRELYDHKNP